MISNEKTGEEISHRLTNESLNIFNLLDIILWDISIDYFTGNQNSIPIFII